MRKIVRTGLTFAALASIPASIPAWAGSPAITYAPAGSWVAETPAATTGATPPGAAARIAYSDIQIRVGPWGTDSYTAYRVKLLSPEALAAGNIATVWSPDAAAVTVHFLRLIRDGKVTDVLQTTKFATVQRESNLEASVLDGQLTATLQVPGLQIGDELEFGVTVRAKDPTLGDRHLGFAAFSPGGSPGAYRLRLVWPQSMPLRWATTSDLGALTAAEFKGERVLTFELRDPPPVKLTEGAPPRYNLRRFLEFSDFANWNEVSQRLAPLYEKASVLGTASPVRAEIARIAAASSDPAIRATAALRLVQERIRYVYVGLNGANYTPAPADQTWQRRFGDCKGKTVLLLALLRGLAIDAVPVLVSSNGGDGMGDRLPNPGLFDHVIIRAAIGGKNYWLDGTKLGERSLAVLIPPAYRWVLPLTADGAALIPGPITPARSPFALTVVDIDAREGTGGKARVKARQIFRGDEALQLRAGITALSPDQADTALRAFWRQGNAWIEADKVAWRYADDKGALEFSVEGDGDLDWSGDAAEGRSLDVLGAGFVPPDRLRRPKDQDQTAPWAVDFPRFRCWATTIRLPPADTRWKWDYFAAPMNLALGGESFYRASDLRGGTLRTVMSRRAIAPQIDAALAARTNAQIPGFNNKISRVYQVAATEQPDSHPSRSTPPFDDATDWLSPDTPCSPAGAVP